MDMGNVTKYMLQVYGDMLAVVKFCEFWFTANFCGYKVFSFQMPVMTRYVSEVCFCAILHFIMFYKHEGHPACKKKLGVGLLVVTI